MRISVLVATYNRAPLLDECLTHLGRQPFEPGDEVVIVDNGSTDATPDVIRRHAAAFRAPLRHLTEPSPGKSVALARAVSVAAGEILAFTDDDVDVEEDWLPAIRAALRDPDLALVGGPVAPRWEAGPPRWIAGNGRGYGRLSAPLAIVDYGPEPSALGPRTLLGANLAVRRSVLEKIGGFALHLGKLRGTLLSGEDQEFCERVQAGGFRVQYRPEIRVRHWVPAERVRFLYVISWFFWLGITNAALDRTGPSRSRTVSGVPLYVIRRVAGAILGAPIAAVTGHMTTAMEHAADAAFGFGYAAKRWHLVGAGDPVPVCRARISP